MDNDAVRYSRAGDAFHYRWAARRCLKLLDPNTTLQCITVEGSRTAKAAGEYVIDLAEYSRSGINDSVAFYQLKHTTRRRDKKFTLSELKDTLIGFAGRFSANVRFNQKRNVGCTATFHFVTNRPVGDRVKKLVEDLANGANLSPKLRQTFERLTGLKNQHLRSFCSSFFIVDDEGDYAVQKQKLHGEMAEYIAGFINSDEVDKLINLVSERVLPNSNREIHREDVLQKLGVSSERALFPAPPMFEKLSSVIVREQQGDLLQQIIKFHDSTIVHAAGGVGKSVVARQIVESLPNGSVGVLYDCFGGGKYRNRSEPRHRACDALIQMANELAIKGLCTTLIGHSGIPSDALFRSFLDRLKTASAELLKANKKALLVLLIDAADNAEMAAEEFSESCFVRELLREKLPAACRLVMLCRTERVHLLSPPSHVRKFQLRPFSKSETSEHLRKRFPNALIREAIEFYRLTGGNPRVQANALAVQKTNLHDILGSLGPVRTTVDDQIADQLASAIATIRDKQTQNFTQQIDAICYGLANLPPFIPIEVLAAAANVEPSAVQSFISDLGRPLWHSDDSVQFRDEPTETWFRKRFAANKEKIRGYVGALEPLAEKFTYVSKTLPQLLLKCGDYERLVRIALSDDQLPKDNPIDERDIRVFRLQFAFKAALRLNRIADAAQLAFRAGEEVAGNKRQLEVLKQNVDLIAPLQDAHRVQEIAYRQFLGSAWQGSENLYSASLLSCVRDFHGEAVSYLRSARKWLQIYFRTREGLRGTEFETHPFHQQLGAVDIAEFVWTNLNLSGAKAAAKELMGWRPPLIVFTAAQILAGRLIDAGRFKDIDEIACLGQKNPHLIVGLTAELASVGKLPPKDCLTRTLNSVSGRKSPFSKPNMSLSEDAITPALISFAEACASSRLSRKKIINLLEAYAPTKLERQVTDDYYWDPRRTILRAVALLEVLRGNTNPKMEALLPNPATKKTTPKVDNGERGRVLAVANVMLPLYIHRARVIARDKEIMASDHQDPFSSFESHMDRAYNLPSQRLPYEASRIRFEVCALNHRVPEKTLTDFAKKVVDNPKAQFMLPDRLRATRTAFRLPHLQAIRTQLEMSCGKIANEIDISEGPEGRADSFIDLARAVLPVSKSDASAYFHSAIEAVSKFGDEMVDRWEALVAVARRAATRAVQPELAYRFVRCAEVVGDTVTREKYWNRNDVFCVMLHLDAPGAFAALSRWKDRDVGWFGNQVEALITEAVEAEKIAPTVAWALTGFAGCNHSGHYAAACIRKIREKQKRQELLDAAISDFERFGRDDDHWHQTNSIKALDEVANEFQLESTRLKELIKQLNYDAPKNQNILQGPGASNRKMKQKLPNWKGIFRGVDVMTAAGIVKAIGRVNDMQPPRPIDEVWPQLISRVRTGRESDFLKVLLLAENLDIFDIGHALKAIPLEWKNRAAVKRLWPSFLTGAGERLGHQLSHRGSLEYWMENGRISNADLEHLREGMLKGLAESPELADASAFFGFITNISARLSQREAVQLTDFALSRFEKHIPENFGDGAWGDWLVAPPEINDAVTGLIWATLGSPHAETRWEAAHAVKRLGQQRCAEQIGALMRWMRLGTNAAFGCHRYPFYSFHAKLYLLIALRRIAVDTPEILKTHTNTFAEIALDGVPHILIQKIAAEISMLLEKHAPGTFPIELAQRLEKVGKSVLPVLEKDQNAARERSPWHKREEVDRSLKVHFAYDFDRYWFPALARVFDLSEDEFVELATQVAHELLGIPSGDDFVRDPRQQQWNTLDRRGLRTWATHGEYSRVDNFSFYYSYHSVMSVAAKLISEMPVVQHRSRFRDDEDRWTYWLRHHLLSRIDGKWLADRRDPSPFARAEWTRQSIDKDWLCGIKAQDFFEAIQMREFAPHWICVHGAWDDCQSDYEETITVDTALVNPETANALASALRTCEDQFHIYLPTDDEERQNPPDRFKLLKWIRVNGEGGGGLDRFDPYAAEIYYPPDDVEKEYETLLGISPDLERRWWTIAGKNSPSLISQIWAEEKDRRESHHPNRSGRRIIASVDLLTDLCGKTGMEIIFLVKIERQQHRHYSVRDEDDPYQHVPPSHKVFILEANGTLRDKTESYKLR